MGDGLPTGWASGERVGRGELEGCAAGDGAGVGCGWCGRGLAPGLAASPDGAGEAVDGGVGWATSGEGLGEPKYVIRSLSASQPASVSTRSKARLAGSGTERRTV